MMLFEIGYLAGAAALLWLAVANYDQVSDTRWRGRWQNDATLAFFVATWPFVVVFAVFHEWRRR